MNGRHPQDRSYRFISLSKALQSTTRPRPTASSSSSTSLSLRTPLRPQQAAVDAAALLASNTPSTAVAVHASAFTCGLANGNEDVDSYERQTRQTEFRDCMHTPSLISLLGYFTVSYAPPSWAQLLQVMRDWSDVKLSILQLSNDLHEDRSPAAAATSPLSPPASRYALEVPDIRTTAHPPPSLHSAPSMLLNTPSHTSLI